MKKILAAFLVLAMMFAFVGCGGGLGGSKEGPRPGTAYIDDCYIEITDCKAQVSTSPGAFGQLIAVVWVDFENNSDAATNLFFTANINAYQNGMELSGASWRPDDHGIDSTRSHSDNIQPGYSLSTGYAFVIEDSSAPVTIQICDGLEVISEKTFNI